MSLSTDLPADPEAPIYEELRTMDFEQVLWDQKLSRMRESGRALRRTMDQFNALGQAFTEGLALGPED